MTATADNTGFTADMQAMLPGVLFTCTLSGMDFTCEDLDFGGSFVMGLNGTFGDSESAKGEWTWTYEAAELGMICDAPLPYEMRFTP